MTVLRHRARLRVAIVDTCSAKGYDLPDLAAHGLGGTEATILRVAVALAPQFGVTLYQNGRAAQALSRAGRLCPLAAAFAGAGADVIVVVNRWKVALKLRRRHPDTPIFLWLHVHPGRHNRAMGAALRSADIAVICVSASHARTLTAFLGPQALPRIGFIHNPIADDLHPDDTPRDPDLLLFASSPHKGLTEVFGQFRTLRASLPKLRLAVADPGYLRWATGPAPEGVVFLGALPHPALIAQMRRALCLFYPQTGFAETFGLVLAEANAVGTPVLVHDGLGANAEIVRDPAQRVDGHDPDQIRARIEAWRRTPPCATPDPAFRLRRVAQDWARLLSGAMRTPAAATQIVEHHA
ncbi:glycosyltransferase [Paracoccus stylophorae]|uniref:Glycosyltransferase n=1 Tax=Paracoccus stylophorae TaxID=659350 RepID=A0ABY7SUG8_9RHOB|nr:glycosyltransferase [Paracoccus stylophorae]WCR10681.1 glycosyltransferase [Paracoccus stylophorae]